METTVSVRFRFDDFDESEFDLLEMSDFVDVVVGFSFRRFRFDEL